MPLNPSTTVSRTEEAAAFKNISLLAPIIINAKAEVPAAQIEAGASAETALQQRIELNGKELFADMDFDIESNNIMISYIDLAR